MEAGRWRIACQVACAGNGGDVVDGEDAERREVDRNRIADTVVECRLWSCGLQRSSHRKKRCSSCASMDVDGGARLIRPVRVNFLTATDIEALSVRTRPSPAKMIHAFGAGGRGTHDAQWSKTPQQYSRIGDLKWCSILGGGSAGASARLSHANRSTFVVEPRIRSTASTGTSVEVPTCRG